MKQFVNLIFLCISTFAAAQLTLTTAPPHGVAPLTVQFTATCSVCVAYTWNFGDGSGPPPVEQATETHIYKNLGIYTAIVSATDAQGNPYSAQTTITVVNQDNAYCGPGNVVLSESFDGPAAMPTACINTELSGTPSPGAQTLVPAGGDVNTALVNASCGDTILLAAGASFKGPIKLPAKSCDSGHWITIRTSAPDSSLPPEGSRITPCYAGVASLPGRPDYGCTNPQNVMAQIVLGVGNIGTITVEPGANHYRIIGLELTRPAGTGIVYTLVKMEGADSLIFDRDWFHGTALEETTRGIYLGDSTNVAAVDSYFTDFHCIAGTGACTDAQAINGGNSFVGGGTYKIVNNFLEAAAENVLFGGANGSTIPTDIEIRHNYMFKPLTWMPSSPNYIGTAFIVKNLFELKNAQRVLFEGNVLEDCWGGFTQVGYGMLLTPRGPWAAVEDVTVRYNTFSHVGSGFQIAASRFPEPDGTIVDSLANQRVSIHDDTVDDMSAATYNGDGIGFQISSGLVSNTPLNNVRIEHVTMLTDPAHTLMIVGAAAANPVLPFNITFDNNVAIAGQYSVWSTGTKDTVCAKSGQPQITFNQCWSSYSVTSNGIIAYPSTQGPWPSGQMFASDVPTVAFTNYNNGNGGDYTLLSISPFKGKGSDGADLGANIAAVNYFTKTARNGQ